MLTRRHLFWTAAGAALAACAHRGGRPDAAGGWAAEPLPLHAVRLQPSIFQQALDANRRFLNALDPDRLLHNFHASAGLPTRAEVYGGWEARGIAGHTLGHHLSACSLMFAQQGDRAMQRRVGYMVAELSRCQQAHGDGYVGGTTVERDGRVLDGKVVFEEVRRGHIRAGGFDVNGGWVPLYTWHKVHAGLIDAYRLCGDQRALAVMLGMAAYLGTILEGLSDEQLQRLLAAEHGGLNETYAETCAITGEQRWLDLARRIRHRQVLDPLSRGHNILPGLHANTQIPKIIGLARLHELTGDPVPAETARFFHHTVTLRHSYVIGGHSEREHFRAPDVIAEALNDRTCEACNSYNMLKLTRHLFGWAPDARLFDYYEHTHLNHIMAHQHPDSGMFAYFMPMSSGAGRTYSTMEESFWCCMGSGMESHAKHGDSIYWQSGGERLFVNLFVPSRVRWSDGGMDLRLDTGFPLEEEVRLTVATAPAQPRTLAVRLPGWCRAPGLALNGETIEPRRRQSYALIHRVWQAGDTVTLSLPMEVSVAPAPDDAGTVAFVHGPLVLAADLGPADAPFDQLPPALIETDPAQAIERVPGERFHYRLSGALPAAVTLKPFFDQYDRRTAVYFPLLTREEQAERQTAFEAARRRQARIDRRTVDVIRLGEPPSERAHRFRSNHSDVIAWGARNGRQAWWGEGNYIECDLAVAPGPLVLRALYWGEEVDKDFDVIAGGRRIAREERPGPPIPEFVAIDYPLPPELTAGVESLTVRVETRGSDAPVYELRLLKPG